MARGLAARFPQFSRQHRRSERRPLFPMGGKIAAPFSGGKVGDARVSLGGILSDDHERAQRDCGDGERAALFARHIAR
jgi:hypothetical protein